ncbi:MAG: nicotinate-nucleotide adenylyltransferase [Firmicutes bacterium]|nr:nicotinate-nucleotide adenylyltransferase [Bacillota bacterium]
MKENKVKKIGIMGGTFDPIHIGHLILGENAWHQFALEKVLFMPSANPPHKRQRTGRASVQERIDMVRLAIEGNPHFELSLAEAFSKDYCYTQETLQRLKLEHPDTEYYFIMGADSLFAFETWKNPQEICKNCVLTVAVRDHVLEKKFMDQIAYLTEKFQAKIEVLDTPNIDISSHDIRRWLRTGDISLRYYVPDDVISYIITNNLYSECEN